MPVDPLLDMARRACIRYARRIDDIGDLPYDFVRPILLKIEMPEQLHEIEQKCPQIIGHDSEIWLAMIKRDIVNWESKPHQPSNPENWYKVYRKLRRDMDNEKAANMSKLKTALSTIHAQKEESSAKVVTYRPLSYDIPLSKRKHPSDYPRDRMQTAYVKMTALEKIRKESRDARNPRMSRPTHLLAKPNNRVARAPAGFVEDLRRNKEQHMRASATSPTTTSRPMSAKLPTRAAPQTVPGPQYNLTHDREARLRALKSGKKPESAKDNTNHEKHTNNQQGLSAQFLEDDDLDDDYDNDDDLFGAVQKMKAPPVPFKAPVRRVPRLAVSTPTSKKRTFDKI